jgi:hypothetical protein
MGSLFLSAPAVGLEPTTNALHLPLNFLRVWTISSSELDAGRFAKAFVLLGYFLSE